MKRFSILVLLTVCACCVTAVAREKINLNERWSFVLGDNQQYGQPQYDDTQWRVLDLPHDWSIEGKYDKSNPSGPMGGYMPCGTGWYRKRFSLPSQTQGKRFFVRFDGVHMRSQVWINGRMVGEYPNGYNSFEYDITSFVKHDEENILAVRVDNSLQPASRWYTGSGIYRAVNLVVTDQLHIVDESLFLTTPEVSAERATINVDYKIICNNYPETRFTWSNNKSLFIWTRDENSADQVQMDESENRVQKECTLKSVLYDAQGREVASAVMKKKVGDFSEHRISQQLVVTNPKLWSVETPNLYRLVSSVAYEGVERDCVANPVGIREFEYSVESGMKLNGKPIKVQGVCLHQSVGAFGSAVPVGVWRERMTKLKEMGCNAIRSHYPMMSEFNQLCDSLGLLVSVEILDEWNRGQEWGYSESSYGKLAYTYHLYFEQWHDTDQRRAVRNARNHPSVFMYQLGNEIPNQRINGIELAQKLRAITKEEDPTRPVTAACDFFVGANLSGFMDQFDFGGYNYIDRIHPDSLYAAEQARYPNRILLGTETYHITRNHVSVRDTPSCIGEFVWVGYDYIGEIVWPDYRGWDFGILDIAGFPKPEYYLRKSYWSDKPVVHIAVERSATRKMDWATQDVADHWNWADRGASPLPVYVYSNCDEVELIVGTKSLGRKKVGSNDYFAQWSVPFKAGRIRAVGYDMGKRVCEHVLTTAEQPSELSVSRIYEGDDVVRVEVEVVDKHGVKVHNADNLVVLDNPQNVVTLGFDNGSQHDPKGLKYTSKRQGYAADGRLVVYVRRGQVGKQASFTLKADGLKAVEVTY